MSVRSAPALRRDASHRLLAGVCAGIARQLGIDPLVVRIAFLAAAFAGGLGFAVYGVMWVLVPADGAAASPVWRPRAGRAAVEVALGVGLLVLSALLTFRALGLWWSDTVVWPVVLVAAGGGPLGGGAGRPPPPPGAPPAAVGA